MPQDSCDASRNGLHIRISGSGLLAQEQRVREHTVFGNVVEVVAADDEGAGHLRRDDTTSQDAATDGDLASEGALLVWSTGVCLRARNGFLDMNAPM